MQILDQIVSPGLYGRKHFLKGSDLLPHFVAAIVDQDIDRTNFIAERAQKAPVFLITDDDFDLVFLEAFAFRTDIDADDPGSFSEVMLPHLQ